MEQQKQQLAKTVRKFQFLTLCTIQKEAVIPARPAGSTLGVKARIYYHKNQISTYHSQNQILKHLKDSNMDF